MPMECKVIAFMVLTSLFTICPLASAGPALNFNNDCVSPAEPGSAGIDPDFGNGLTDMSVVVTTEEGGHRIDLSCLS